MSPVPVRMRWLALSVAALSCAPAGEPSPGPPTTRSVVVFSDLHFNPFSDSTLVDSLQKSDVSRWKAILSGSGVKAYSTYGTDTNYPLLESALAAMKWAAPSTELVLFAGDFMGHGFQEAFRRTARDTSAAALAAFTDQTTRFLAQEIAAAFPGAQILPALGNNDSGCGDYKSEPGSAFLRSFAEAWQQIVNRRGVAPEFATTFSAAGHYTAFAPAVRARVVVLNDVYWSPKYANACGSSTANFGRETLVWLDRVLTESRSRGESVWLLTHAPIGVDAFATLRKDSVVTMLDPEYAADLISLLSQFAGTVRYGVYGHTHMTEFQVISDSAGRARLGNQGIPAVSPIFGNNPAFVVLALDSAARITDYTVHTLTNLTAAGANGPGVWSPEYAFRDAFGADGLSANALAAVEQSLLVDSIARERFIRFYDSGSGRAGPSDANWRAYWCAIGNLEPAGFTRCYRGP